MRDSYKFPRSPRAAWLALWAGSYRVESHGDAGDRHYLTIGHSTRAPLSERQRQVCVALAAGYSQVQISEALGIAPNTVATYLSHGVEKLGLRGADLASLVPNEALFVGDTIDAALGRDEPCPCPAGACWDGRTLSWPVPRVATPDTLTPAQIDVLRLRLTNNSAAAIARARGTSARTVANQLNDIYKKLGVSGYRSIDPAIRTHLIGQKL